MEPQKNGEAPKPVDLAAFVGKKFKLSKLERLESRAGLASMDLEFARLEQAKGELLAGIGARVLRRVGISAAQAPVLSLGFQHDPDGSLVGIEILEPPKRQDGAELSGKFEGQVEVSK